jgi:ankyrin repeat protein
MPIDRHSFRSRIPLSSPIDEEMAVWLLDHGADLNRTCDLDLTPMSFAMADAPLAMIGTLFSRGGNIRNGQLIHHAVLREGPDASELVRKLVEEHKAPFGEVKYEKDSESFFKRSGFGLGTALHRAAEFNKREIVEYLLSKGADPLKLDTRGKTPRFWADKRGYQGVADLLKAAEDQQQGLNN